MADTTSDSYVDKLLNFLRSPGATTPSQGAATTAPQAPVEKPPLYDNTPSVLRRLLEPIESKVFDVVQNPGALVTENKIKDGRIVAPDKPTFDQAFPMPPKVAPAPAVAAPAQAVPIAPPAIFAPRMGGGQPAPSAGALGAVADAAPAAPAGALAAPAPAVTTAPADAVPRKSLMDIYQDIIKKIPSAADVAPKDQAMTEQQKDKLRLNFWLNMMSNSMKPGAYMLGAMGDAGKTALAGMDDYQKQNLTAAEKLVAQQRSDAINAVNLQDKDTDNQRADRKESSDEKHWQAEDANSKERLKLLRDQLAQGKWKAVNSAKTGTVVLYDGDSGQTKDTGIKYDRGGGTASAEERIVDRASRDPQFLETMLQLKGKTGDVADSGVFKAGMELIKGDMTGKMTPEAAMDMARRAAAAASGGRVSTAAGAVPQGMPAGSTQVGTSGGKRVFQSPDGKRFIEK